MRFTSPQARSPGLHLTFENSLRASRFAHGIRSQAELARRLRLPELLVWQWESGHGRPTDGDLVRLTEVLPLLGWLVRHGQVDLPEGSRLAEPASEERR